MKILVFNIDTLEHDPSGLSPELGLRFYNEKTGVSFDVSALPNGDIEIYCSPGSRGGSDQIGIYPRTSNVVVLRAQEYVMEEV